MLQVTQHHLHSLQGWDYSFCYFPSYVPKQNDPEKERKEEIKFNRLHTIYDINIHHRKLDLKKP